MPCGEKTRTRAPKRAFPEPINASHDLSGKLSFCKVCGIKSFYVPRSNPDGYDVNVRCLEPRPEEMVVEPFDGKNWELHASGLAHLSKEA
jgi:hypothetical protein